MKRLFSLLLALGLCMSLAAPAAAMTPPAAPMEQDLAEVTALVKDTLRVDQDYTEFYGDFYEDLAPRWSLNWSDEARSLSVTCDEEGKVLDAYAYTDTDSGDRFYGFDPAFPALSEAEARAMAEELLARLMGAQESARIDRTAATTGEDANYRFYGTILLNGLESPLTFTIRMDKNGLRSYSRSDSYTPYVGGLPAGNTDVTEADASAALNDTIALELYYVYDEGTGEARLQYMPVGARTVVDGVTGEAVDMEALYAGFLAHDGVGYAMTEAAAAEAPMALGRGDNDLSPMELESIGNYADAMTQEEVDALLRSMTLLGITEEFALQRCSYSMDSENGDITVSLRYTAEMTEDNLYGFSKKQYNEQKSWGDTLTIYKYITADAKTGRLLSLSTGYPLWEKDEPYNTDAPSVAEEFMSLCAVEMYPSVELCTLSGYEQGESLTYARVEKGYFYPENYISLEVNSATGTVDSYHFSWDEDVTFADPAGIVTAEEAAAAYADALTVTLGYVAWPEEVRRDDPELLRYIDYGYTWVESLRLGWYFGGTDEVASIDAHTGEPVGNTDGEDGVFLYSDIEDLPEKASVEALAQAGIGFAGGLFEGEKELTQGEAVFLLLQAAGYDPADWDEETLRNEAVYQGFITGESWDGATSVSRMEFLKMMVGASRYGDAAALAGIWDTSFNDVDDEDEGYAAIAEALGLAEGKKLRPHEACTRAMAAEFLCAFMTR